MPDSLWYKDAIIYEAHVRAFFDSNDDGVGDFRGLIQKLDYIHDLGVTCIWLLPFFASPLRDDGYDVADYENVHPSYGNLDDCQAFIDAAHARGLRVLFELVVNHTSDAHPWFQAARRAPPGSREREFYVWSDTDQKFPETRIIFSDTEKSNWTFDPVAGQYYWHRFFSHQPDLNHNNPEVVQAVLKVMQFWLDRGVDALRLDAVPYLCVREGTTNENLPETHAVLKQMRRWLDERYRDRMLLAEANQWPSDVREFFGDGDECHMGYHFPLMPRMYMAVRQEDRHPITEILRQTPEIPETSQWALFLRNHDELTLEMVTDDERDYMYQQYAVDPKMRLNMGIRRRLAPLLDNSRRRIELMNSLLFSMPGTPIVYYGDEIGMGDNIYLGDRHGVRTPMQWSPDRNAGFSRADPARLYLPVIMDPVYGYEAINVEAQQRYQESLLSWMKRMIALRNRHKTFGRGTLEFLHPKNRKVLAYVRRHEDETILCLANLSRTVQPVELDLAAYKGLTPVEMLGTTEFPRIGDHAAVFTLTPYAFLWFQLQQAAAPLISVRAAQPAEPRAADLVPQLFAGSAWETLLDSGVRQFLERDALQPFLKRQRWFGGKARAIRSARFTDWGLLTRTPILSFFTTIDVEYADGGRETYVAPLALVNAAEGDALLSTSTASVVSCITGARKGALVDGLLHESVARALFEVVEGRREVPLRHGRLSGNPRADHVPADGVPVERQRGDQSNSLVRFGSRYILKIFRKVEPGPNPEVEVGRFLTEVVRFPRVPPFEGAMQIVSSKTATANGAADVAVLHRLVSNQGNGWDHAVNELGRFYERATVRAHESGSPDEPLPSLMEAAAAVPPPLVRETVGGYLTSAATLGRRTGELHAALASTDDPAFRPEPVTGDELRQSADEMVAGATAALRLIEASRDRLPERDRPAAEAVLKARDRIRQQLRGLAALTTNATRIRCHNDYHLGQVLVAENDFVILDFEGEPGRPLAERRVKRSPLRDVAGMLRSFSYAAWAKLAAFADERAVDFGVLTPWSALWNTWVSAVFLRAYLTTTAGASFVPGDQQALETLLRTFMLDKALYEVRYELNNRPDWVGIPLRGVLEVLGHG